MPTLADLLISKGMQPDQFESLRMTPQSPPAPPPTLGGIPVPKPDPLPGRPAPKTLWDAVKNFAGGVADEYTGKAGMDRQYMLGQQNAENELLREQIKARHDQQRAFGQTSNARPFQIPTTDEQGAPIWKIVDARGNEVSREPRDPRQQSYRTQTHYSPDYTEQWEVNAYTREEIPGTRRPTRYHLDTLENRIRYAREDQKRAEDTARRAEERGSRPLAGSDISKLKDANLAYGAINKVYDLLNDPKVVGLFGPVQGNVGTKNPYSEDYKKLDAGLRKARQLIGKYMEGGVLRKEDEAKYKAMLPDPGDLPEVAKAKTEELIQMLYDDISGLVTGYRDSGYDVSDSFNVSRPRAFNGGLTPDQYEVVE